MKITTNIVWDHRGRVPQGGIGQLEIRITRNRKSYYMPTGIKVRRSEFVAGRIVNCPGAEALNERLGIIYTKVINLINEAERNNRDINIEDIKRKAWQVSESLNDEPHFLAWIEKQIPLLPVKEGTLKHYWPLYDRLVDFGKMRKWEDVTVENISEFDAWLHTLTKPMSDARKLQGATADKFSDGAIYNYHKCLKALINRAVSFGKMTGNPYDRLRGKFKRGDRESVEYLTEEEMEAFVRLETPEGTQLEVAHDLFVFQMYTGLPFSDAQKFSIKNYKLIGGRWQHTGERIKTGVPYVSSLLPPVIKILEKYNYEIPKINNADYNHALKALGVMAGINTRLHSHLARHTFATWMIRNGAKIENVSRMLGHTNIIQTQRYAKVLAQSVHDDFELVARKMEK